jgi:hypothetical protein
MPENITPFANPTCASRENRTANGPPIRLRRMAFVTKKAIVCISKHFAAMSTNGFWFLAK